MNLPCPLKKLKHSKWYAWDGMCLRNRKNISASLTKKKNLRKVQTCRYIMIMENYFTHPLIAKQITESMIKNVLQQIWNKFVIFPTNMRFGKRTAKSIIFAYIQNVLLKIWTDIMVNLVKENSFTQQDYHGRLCVTLLHSYCTSTYTEVTVLLLWSSSNATLEYPCACRYSNRAAVWVLHGNSRVTSKEQHGYFSVGTSAVTV